MNSLALLRNKRALDLNYWMWGTCLYWGKNAASMCINQMLLKLTSTPSIYSTKICSQNSSSYSKLYVSIIPCFISLIHHQSSGLFWCLPSVIFSSSTDRAPSLLSFPPIRSWLTSRHWTLLTQMTGSSGIIMKTLYYKTIERPWWLFRGWKLSWLGSIFQRLTT